MELFKKYKIKLYGITIYLSLSDNSRSSVTFSVKTWTNDPKFPVDKL